MNAQLSWATSAGATSYDVYFGTTTNPPLVGNVATTTYNPGALSANTQYFWKIVPQNANGPATGCSEWSFTTLTPPANDECSNPTNLPCGTSNLAGTTVGTLAESSSPGGCASLYGVWYSFAGDGQSTTISSTAGSGFDHEMDIFSGSCGALTTITCLDAGASGGTETYTFISTIGTTYFVYVAHYSTSSTSTGTFTISRTCTPATPPNCTTITTPANLATNVAIAGNITFAAATNATSYDVYLDQNATPTTLLGNTVTTSIAYSGLSNNTTYYVLIVPKNSAGSATGCTPTSFTTVPPAPGNDNCENAAVLPESIDNSCANAVTGTTAGASYSSNYSSCSTFYNEVWYSFTPSLTANYNALLTINSGSSSTYVSIWSGTCGSLTKLNSSCYSTSFSNIALTAGTTYYVSVATYYTSSANFTLCIYPTPPPPANNDCSSNNAYLVTVNSDETCTNTTVGDSRYATQSLAGCAGTADDDVWYSFVASNTSHIVTVTPSGSPAMSDVVFQVFDACGGTSIVCKDGTAGSNAETATITGLTIGNTYFIRVYSYGNGTGSGVFTICINLPPAVPGCATLATPADGATGVVRNTPLTWTAPTSGGTPTGYKVYLGTVTNPALVTTVTALTYTPSGQAYSTTYYWRIVPTNATGDAVGCTTEYSYTTEAAPPPPDNNAPCDATALTFGGTLMGTTVNATTSSVSDVACDGYTNTNADVWYKIEDVDSWVGGTLIVTLTPSSTQDFAIYLYSFTDCASPSLLACSDIGLDGDDETITYTVPAPPGIEGGNSTLDIVSYMVRVKQWSTSTGTFDISLTGTLPLDLVSFTGIADKDVNFLNWKTVNEVNADKFIVERSIDGNKWEYVADVNASGNSKAERSYTATDEKPYSLSYYRIKMIDRDGRYSYSKNISIERKDNTFRLYSVSPNPNNGNFAVTFNSMGSGKTNLVVVNSLGMKVYTKSVDTKAGTNNEFLGIDNLTDGIYTLILEQNGQIVTQRIAINK